MAPHVQEQMSPGSAGGWRRSNANWATASLEEPFMREYRVISADGHTIEPPDMWLRYLPKKFHEQAPRLVKDPEGGDAWEFQRGVAPMPIGLVTTPGKTYEQMAWFGSTYATINRGCFEGAARLAEQDRDGVDA